MLRAASSSTSALKSCHTTLVDNSRPALLSFRGVSGSENHSSISYVVYCPSCRRQFLPRYAMRKCVYAVVRCMAGWVAVCLSRSCVVLKRLQIRLQLLRMQIANRVPKLSNDSIFSDLE